MPSYLIRFHLESPVRTPFQADTIFGHLAWALRYTRGEGRLTKWLQDFPESPTLVSDAFPEGFLPKPILASLGVREGQELREELSQQIGPGGRIQFYDRLKSLRKIRLIPEALFKLVQGSLSTKELCRHMLTGETPTPRSKEELVAHNTISRTTSSVLVGGFLQFAERFYEPGARFFFYLRSEDLTLRDIKGMLGFIENGGYGADKSTGKGVLAFEEPESVDVLYPRDADAFVTLSPFVPDPNCSMEGSYEIFTKFGKLGGEYSNIGNPFKKPLIMMQSGSTFRSSPDGVYGQLLSGVHPDERIRHYAYAFPLGVHLGRPQEWP